MVTIGNIPTKIKHFFKPVKKQVSSHVFQYFQHLVLGICISHGATLDKLVKLFRNSTHRTNHGEFLHRSIWDESHVLQQVALDMLMSLMTTKDQDLYLIIDDTQTLKRAKKMDAVGKLHHHSTGKYGTGHTIVKACLWYRGVTIPWASVLYVKKQHAPQLKVPFAKLTELAGQVISNAMLPEIFNVTVLFDCFYMCPVVANACKDRKWHYISVGKPNRNITVRSEKRKLSEYGRNVLNNSGKWKSIKGLRKTRQYRIADRIGYMSKLGEVRVVFSRRRNDRKPTCLVTSKLNTSAKTIVSEYLKRWAIELLIKDEKQHLGLGDYRVLRYRAVVRHLHLVDCAYACLTHVGIKTSRAQGNKKNSNRVLVIDPVSKLKQTAREIIWKETVQDVIKYSHERPVIKRLERLLAA
jgi:SRSO17 transposase